MVKEYLTFDAQAVERTMIVCSDNPDVEEYNVVMAVEGTNHNRAYFSNEVLSELAPTFVGVPLNLDHDTEHVSSIVGYIKDSKVVDGKLVGKAVLSPNTSNYKSAHGYISSRFDAGGIPNVSVGIWADVDYNEEENRKDILGGYADHLALVVHGACDEGMGCGVGLGILDEETECKTCEDYHIKLNVVFDFDSTEEEDEQNEILKQVLIKKIRHKEEYNE